MLISIGRALSQERDIQSLLAIILRRACEVTNADAGSIYIVEGHDEDVAKRTLRFEVSQNDSRARCQSAGFTMPVSATSIVGHVRAVAATGSTSPTCTRSTSRAPATTRGASSTTAAFDDKYRYQTRSMLTVPMISARTEVIGVIQLINKRAKGWIQLDLPSDFEDGVVPFDDVSEALRRRRSRRRPASRSRTSSSTTRSRRCSTASSRRRSPRSSRAIRRRPVTPSASPSSPSGSRDAVNQTEQRPLPRGRGSRATTSRRSSTRRCSTTSARSACASTCWSRRRSSTSTSAS